MSYDLDLVNPVTRQTLQSAKPHSLRGGTYALGGTTELSLNMTYNYADHFYRVFGEKGIRIIHGMTGLQSIPVLKAGMDKLGDDVHDDYWQPTEGNAKAALSDLIILAAMGLDGVWVVD